MEVGAVAAMRYVKDGIKAARFVLQHTEHTMLVGEKASAFAISMGLPGPFNLSSAESMDKWMKWKENSCQPNFWKNVVPTIVVVLTIKKNLQTLARMHAWWPVMSEVLDQIHLMLVSTTVTQYPWQFLIKWDMLPLVHQQMGPASRSLAGASIFFNMIRLVLTFYSKTTCRYFQLSTVIVSPVNQQLKLGKVFTF